MHHRVRLVGMLIPLLVLSATLVFAANFDLLLDGNISDMRHLPNQTRQNHDFTFVRLMYNGRIPGYIKNWYTDYPAGDENLIRVLHRMTDIDIAPESRVIPIHHPDLFNYPMIYSVEAGQMVLNESDGSMLREYLTRGGFWMIDDFWGSFEWANFEKEMRKILPDHSIVDIPQNHPIFHSVYDIDETLQVPNIGYAYTSDPITWEQDGYKAHTRGIFDNSGRLLVFINFNTDLMDASEWADDPKYPHVFSAYSYKIFTNAVVYALSH